MNAKTYQQNTANIGKKGVLAGKRRGIWYRAGTVFFCQCAKGVPWLRKEKGPHLWRPWCCWWARTDLNRGPKDYESSALTN